MNSFDQILSERAERLATRHLRREGERLPTHILVAIGPHILALKAQGLAAVARPPITPVPLARPPLYGVAAYQGTFWPVLQLGPTPGPQVIFLREQGLAIMVDRMEGLVSVDLEELLPCPTVLPEPLKCIGMTPQGWVVAEVIGE